MNYKQILLALCFYVSATSLIAQHYKVDVISKDHVSRLSFIAGQWEGEGWMIGPDRKKHEFRQTENIQFKLDSTVLLIEGKGTSSGKLIHNALAIVSYDKEHDNYTFRSYLQNGQNNAFTGELNDQVFTWYPNENIRYQIWINEEGNWMEKGERAYEGKWVQFFEMELEPVDKK